MKPPQDKMPPSGLGRIGYVAPSAVMPTKSDDSAPEAGRQKRIALAAYYRAEQRGFIPGLELDDWLSAEAELGADADSDIEIEGVGGGKDAQPRSAPSPSSQSS